ncbi:MAG: hypothetical protein WCO00_10720 [Rhodospirillaceae bacterium]
MIGFGRDKPVSGHRLSDPRGLADRALARPPLCRPAHPPGHHLHGPSPSRPAPVPAWWPGLRRGLPSLAVALLLVLFGMGVLYWRGQSVGSGAPALVVWRVPGQQTVSLSAVDPGRWRAFLSSRYAAQMTTRQAILDQARGEMAAALLPVFVAMKGRVKDYIGWFYFFPTTYRMAFTSVIAVLTRDAGDSRAAEQVATESLNRLLQDRFLEVVVVPEKFGPSVEAAARAVQARAIERAEAAAAGEIAALSGFMTEHGKPAAAGSAQPVVVSWEALGLPAPASAMSAPPDAVALIKADPALTGLQTTATTEGMMLVARQIARRMVNSAVSDAARTLVVPMLAGSALGPVEAVATPLLGVAAFGVGVGAEFGAVKMRELVEGERLTSLSNGIVDHLRDNQSRVLSEGVARRVETWLGG